MIWSNILELLINFKLEFATLAFNMTPFGPYGFYKQVNNSGQLEFKSLKVVGINNGATCYETPNEVVVFIGNVLPPNSNNDIYLADTPEDVADIPTEGLNAGDLVYIISTESYQSWDGDSWEDYTPGEPLIPSLADVLDQGNTSGPNDIVFDNNQGLLFDNASRLREGTIDAGLGGNKGIAQVCSLDYELKWEAGRLYVMDQTGSFIRQSLYNFTTTPTATDDTDKGYMVGSLWTLDDGTTYVCTDATATSADWIIQDNQTFTKDANDNVFYNGVSPTLGTSCSKNIFHKTGGAITLGNGAIGNIFEPTENTTNFVFGDNLKNVTVKAGNYPAFPSAGALTLTSGSYAFLYNEDYPSEIFLGDNGNPYHRYYDSANNRYVVTLLISPYTVSYIGGASGGTVTSVNSGTNISVDNTNPAAPIINSLADRYKTTSTSTNTINNNNGKIFIVDANLAYIPLQEVLIVNTPSTHMHGTVVSYNSTTGSLEVDINSHTGSAGPYSSWVINLDGTPVDAITGVGTANEIAYFTGGQVIASLPVATYPSLTELALVKGVSGSTIQTQLNGKQGTLTLTTTGTSGAATLTGSTLNIPQYTGGGGGGTTTNAVTFNNGGLGATSGITFDGSVARTISFNTIGANKAITYGTAAPTGGSDGDIYLQYT